MAARPSNFLPAIPISDRVVSWLGNAVLLAWLGYLLIAPTIGFGWIESWHNEQRAAQLVLLACTALAFIPIAIACIRNEGQRAQHLLRPWFPWWLTLVFALGVISAVRSPHVFAGLAEVSLHVLLALLALLTAIVVSFDIERVNRWARWFALLVSSAYVLGVATRYLAAVNLGRSIDLDVLILGYANPRFPSAFHALLIPFLAVTTSKTGEQVWFRAAAFVALCFIWAINFGLGTRGIWFAYALGLPLAVVLIGWKDLRRLIAVLGLSCVVGVCLYLVLFRGLPALVGSGSAVASPIDNVSTVTSREVLWLLSWRAVSLSPFIGIGPMQFAAYGSHVGAHPHNWILQVASEWGLVVLIALLWSLYEFGNTIRAANSRSSLTAPVTAVAIALALGLVDGNLIMPVSQSGFFLVLGLVIGALYRREEGSSRSKPVPLILAISIVGVLASIALISYASSTLEHQAAETAHFHKVHPGAWLVPRFWEQGAQSGLGD